MNLQVGVKILLKNQDGKYLILHRSLKKYPEVAKKGTWDAPGGRITPGTSLLDNLRREIREETGLEILNQPKIIFAQDILIPEFSDRHVVRLTYIGETNGAEPRLDSEESDDFRWLTYDELKNMPDLDIYLKDFLNQVTL